MGHQLGLLFPLIMIFAAVLDVLTMRIANWVSLALIGAFVGAALIAGMPMQVMLLHFGVGLAVVLATMVLFQLRLFGGGDAKLLAAASVWVGYQQLFPFLIWVTVFGGALAVVMLAYRSVPAGAFPLPDWALRLHKREEGIPYGVAISAGALVVYPMTTIPLLLGH
ncbi:prepilin peptidase CpaA [Hyphomicrobium sp. 1Nfss2.1]|uniref:A24 family peptidase n=1 Tax=Hyphomicrobium sp. 1Nfss2.1 TaxID=3413936 RepID=UPI003C7D7994